MRKVILTSHGHLAEGMQSAVNMFWGVRLILKCMTWIIMTNRI